MPSKKIALGLCMLIGGTGLAQNKTYTVRQGDTILTIAKGHNVPAAELISANHLQHKQIKKGMVLHIPAAKSSTGEYEIKAGDNDWVLAHRLGTTIARLRELNPDVDWKHLQIGDTLKVPHVQVAESTPKIKSRYAIVSKDHAIIRRGPAVNETVVTEVDHGTKVAVLDFNGGWYKLKFPKGTVGWMRGDLLQPSNPPTTALVAKRALTKTVNNPHTVAVAAAKHIVTIAKSVPAVVPPKATVAMSPKPAAADTKVAVATNVETPVTAKPAAPTPAKEAVTAPVSTVEKTSAASTAATVPPTAQQAVRSKPAPSHTEHKALKHKTAVKATYVSSGGSLSADALLERAYRLRGTRYRYGGLSSRGLDCSGFTSTVFRQAGISIPRTSRSQATIGMVVSRSSLKPGDLIFFHTGRSSRINHVGIYIGNGRFIHASSGFGAVREDNLKGHYASQLVTARRIPKVEQKEQSGQSPSQKPKPQDKPEAPMPVQAAPPAKASTEVKNERQ